VIIRHASRTEHFYKMSSAPLQPGASISQQVYWLVYGLGNRVSITVRGSETFLFSRVSTLALESTQWQTLHVWYTIGQKLCQYPLFLLINSVGDEVKREEVKLRFEYPTEESLFFVLSFYIDTGNTALWRHFNVLSSVNVRSFRPAVMYNPGVMWERWRHSCPAGKLQVQNFLVLKLQLLYFYSFCNFARYLTRGVKLPGHVTWPLSRRLSYLVGSYSSRWQAVISLVGLLP
jgi:hypothetical protein